MKAIKIIPYIQKCEFETLQFADKNAIDFIVYYTSAIREIDGVIRQFSNIEDINGGLDTAPYKRLSRIFHYEKVADSTLVLDKLPIEVFPAKCLRFDAWIKNLVKLLSDQS